MNLKGAHVFQAEAIRRASKISAELRDGVELGSLCPPRQSADRHVLDHATTQRAHLGHLETSCLRGGLQHPRSFQTGGRLTTRLPLPRKRVRSIPGESEINAFGISTAIREAVGNNEESVGRVAEARR